MFSGSHSNAIKQEMSSRVSATHRAQRIRNDLDNYKEIGKTHSQLSGCYLESLKMIRGNEGT